MGAARLRGTPAAWKLPGGVRALVAIALALWFGCGVAIAQQETDGESLYDTHCAACHGASGGGGAGPALAGNQALADAEAAIRQVLHGGGGMPAFAGQLNDAEIAAVLTHVRTSWGNELGQVEAEQVAELRGEGASEGSEAEAQEDEQEQAEQGAQQEQDGQQEQNAQQEQDAQDGEQEPDEQDEQDAQDAEGARDQEDAPDAPPPGAGTATLVVRVQPEDAAVEIVGPTGFEPVSREGGEATLEGIPAGPYRVTVLTGGVEYVQLVDLTRGGRAEVVFDVAGGGG